MSKELLKRMWRIYSSVGAAEETDRNKFEANAFIIDGCKVIWQDFLGGSTEEELSNLVHTLIHNIANLPNHLKQWAKRNGKDETRLKKVLDQSIELQIIIDLSNNDKHGYPPRAGGKSKKSPQLVSVNRVMELKTQAKKNSNVGMTLGTDGKPNIYGDGSGKVIINGDVIDKEGNRIGNLYEIERKAVETLEQIMVDYELLTEDNRL